MEPVARVNFFFLLQVEFFFFSKEGRLEKVIFPISAFNIYINYQRTNLSEEAMGCMYITKLCVIYAE